MRKFFLVIVTLLITVSMDALAKGKVAILHVSYDSTREMFQEVNQAFAKYYKNKTGNEVEIRMSHGGSGKQARAVMEGLKADVVSLALSYDIDKIQKSTEKLPKNWQSSLQNNSVPFTSTIVFMVRKGNPKNIKDWDDLVREGVQVVTPNPQSSGGARWMYLSAWGYASKKFDGDETQIMEFIKKLYANVPVLDAGARGATITFAQRDIGDVLVSWENEAILARRELSKGEFEIVYPSLSIVAEPSVATLKQPGHDKKIESAAKEYAKFLFTPEAQRMAAENYFRPVNADIAYEFRDAFPKMETFALKDMFGTWEEAQAKHFDKGGSFDQIYNMK